jgi:hypothetical protein
MRNGASKITCEIDDKNQLEKQFISTQLFHRTIGERVQETTAGDDLNQEPLSLSIRRLKNHTDTSLQ